MPAKAAAKGHGLKRKVFGLPVWAWGAVIVGGIIIGVYMRRKGAGAAPSTDTADAASTGGAGATPSDNGLGSSSTDLQGFLDAQGQLLDQFGQSMQDLIASSQSGANYGDGGFGYSGGDSGGGDSTGTVTAGGPPISLGPYNAGGDLNLSALTPAALKAAWAQYNQTQRRQGLQTQTTIRPSTAGTTQRVAGGAFTQVSRAPAAAVKKVKAIFVPAHGGERAHWALPSGRWVSGPGMY